MCSTKSSIPKPPLGPLPRGTGAHGRFPPPSSGGGDQPFKIPATGMASWAFAVMVDATTVSQLELAFQQCVSRDSVDTRVSPACALPWNDSNFPSWSLPPPFPQLAKEPTGPLAEKLSGSTTQRLHQYLLWKNFRFAKLVLSLRTRPQSLKA